MELKEFEIIFGAINKMSTNNKLIYQKGDDSFVDREFKMGLSNDFKKVIEFAIISHGNQMRKNGNIPYWVHILQVAHASYDIPIDQYSKNIVFCAGILHDIVEDTDKNLNDIFILLNDIFGKEFAKLVVLIVDELTEKFTPEFYPMFNRMERKTLEANRLGSVSEFAKIVKQKDIENNFLGPNGYFFIGGKFAERWANEAKIKMIGMKNKNYFDSILLERIKDFTK